MRDDDLLTVHLPRPAVALLAALSWHAALVGLALLLPERPPPQRPIELEIARSPPPPPPPAAAPAPSSPPRTAAPPRRIAARTPPPVTSPVLPELSPSEDPPDHRAVLPMVERDADPLTPAPSFAEDLLAQLRATRPRAPSPAGGVLAPSTNTLQQVLRGDARLFDDEAERRLAEDYGPFFRRGLEALRGHWHPDDVLQRDDRAHARACGRDTRTTFAVAVIDKAGDVLDVEVKRESGCPALDDEAVAAFKRVARFPHPPTGIFFLPDGTPTDTARYPVRFIVTFDGGLQLDWRG